MPRADPDQPLVVICELPQCRERIPTPRSRAWYTLINHALDEHRAKFLANPRAVRTYLRIVDPHDGRPARVAATRPAAPSG